LVTMLPDNTWTKTTKRTTMHHIDPLGRRIQDMCLVLYAPDRRVPTEYRDAKAERAMLVHGNNTAV